MLYQRIVTAIVLLLVLIPLTLLDSSIPFACLSALFLAAGMWEWARLNQVNQMGALACGVGFLVGAGLLLVGVDLSLTPALLWLLTTVVWMLGSAWMLRCGLASWVKIPSFVRVGMGFALLLAAWLSVVKARLLGIDFLFSVLVLVWAADIGAYFSGKALGQRLFAKKLAPSISPGKSWEGVLGGFAAASLVGITWWYCEPSSQEGAGIYTIFMNKGPIVWGLCVAGLVGLSIVGDLVESMVKRAAGVKDSSQLLPGHGGVLDRLDALLPTLPAALLFTVWLSV